MSAPTSPSSTSTLPTGPTQAGVDALLAASRFREAGFLFASLLLTDSSLPSPRLPSVAASQDWELGFWARLRAAHVANPTDPALQAVHSRMANVAGALYRSAPANAAPTTNDSGFRWVCWVPGCRRTAGPKKPGDLGRRIGHWDSHTQRNADGYDPEPGRRFWVEEWRLEEDVGLNGGNAARAASSRDEFLWFLERDR